MRLRLAAGLALSAATLGGACWTALGRHAAEAERACLEAARTGGDAVAVCAAGVEAGSALAAYLSAAAGGPIEGLGAAARAGLAPALAAEALATLRRADAAPEARAAAMAGLRDAAGQGYAPAQTWLAVALLAGEEGRGREAEAADWLDRAARQGSSDAQFLLAGLHRVGRGIVADRQRARDLYLEAAQRGHAGAAYNLAADHFERGETARGIAWLRRSAAGGFGPALDSLGAISAADGATLAAAAYHRLAGRFSVGDAAEAAFAAAAAAEERLNEAERAEVATRVADLEASIRGEATQP